MLDIICRALDEDIEQGDITSRICVPEERRATGRFLAREELVICGLNLLPQIYDSVGDLQFLKKDGDVAVDNEVIATVTGPARMLLERERVALNFLQRLSGVATKARAFVNEVKGTNCKVLDTRKTTPGLRVLEKMAAATGGATNHRMGLFDAILIKNNHIAAAGGVSLALENAKQANTGLPIEIEVRTRAELTEALNHGATHLLLDNLSPAEATEWIQVINGRATVEISGGITLETAAAYARTGADYISAGAITHSAGVMDISFRLDLL